MPPMVAREAVETSTGNHRPCFLSWRLRSSSTIPGSTSSLVCDIERDDAVQVFGKIDDDAVIDGLAALRGTAAARRDDPPSSRQIASAASASSMVRGSTTPAGMIW